MYSDDYKDLKSNYGATDLITYMFAFATPITVISQHLANSQRSYATYVLILENNSNNTYEHSLTGVE